MLKRRISVNFFLLVLAFFISACQETKEFRVGAQNKTVADKQDSGLPDKKESNTLQDNLIKIQPSTVIEDLKERKKQNPQISDKELAVYGNELLKTKGYNFPVDISEYKQASGNKYILTNPDGKKFTFQMEEPQGHPCFDYINLPVQKINKNELIIITEGKKYELKRPKEFYTEEIVLTDKSFKKIIRKWAAPIDATPLGISGDGRKIYFEYDFGDNEYENELHINELAVEISEDGYLKFKAAKEVLSDKGIIVDYDKKHTEITFVKYKIANKEYFVKYSSPCT